MKEKKLAFNHAWCKGCGICAAFCPRQALKMEKGKVAVADDSLCVRCGLCEQRCPDYAIYIEGGEEVTAHG